MANQVTLTAPSEAAADGPILIEARLTADPDAYYATNGSLDEALTLAAVRRDRPGVILVASVDPEALLYPNPPLPRPAEPQAWTVEQTHRLELMGFGGQRHPGAARYTLLAGFADAVTEGGDLEIQSAARAPVLTGLIEHPAPGRATAETPGLTCAMEDGALGQQLVGRLARPDQTAVLEGGYVNFVAFRLAPDGGGFAGSARVRLRRDGELLTGDYVTPLERFEPPPRSGRHRVYAFSGDLAAEPVDVLVR